MHRIKCQNQKRKPQTRPAALTPGERQHRFREKKKSERSEIQDDNSSGLSGSARSENSRPSVSQGNVLKMDITKPFDNLLWCKPDWSLPIMSEKTNKLLKHCAEITKPQLSDDLEEVIKKSKAFPAAFPIETVRLEALKARRPIEKLKSNIVSTYPIIHERVLLLMTHFLIYKREFGSSIEKAFYKDMSVPDLIDRILKKRALVFMGPTDKYILLSGESGKDGWESVGTPAQKAPLLLENCLSYDEMKLSSMVYVSGHTECINEGKRTNLGVVREEGIQKDAVIIGIVGPRFKRKNRMEFEDIVISKQQNTVHNGYGDEATSDKSPRRMWRQMWSEFYKAQSNTYEDLTSTTNIEDTPTEQKYKDRYVTIPKNNIFDNEVYYKRLSVTAECTLLEADARGKETGRDAFVNVIGAGLGVWMISPHQTDVFVLTFTERVRALLDRDMLQHVSDVNFAYIEPSNHVSALFTNASNQDGASSTRRRIFFENTKHPKGGINVTLEKREPSSRLTGSHEHKLLVITYAWDGNAHPGNEFWKGSLKSSGDPAAACSTQVSELHNAHINNAVSANNTRVVSRHGLTTLAEYAAMELYKLENTTSESAMDV